MIRYESPKILSNECPQNVLSAEILFVCLSVTQHSPKAMLKLKKKDSIKATWFLIN